MVVVVVTQNRGGERESARTKVNGEMVSNNQWNKNNNGRTK